MMVRREDWPLALNAWVDAHRATPFCWHAWDCCSAAADWVQRCTGVDVFAQYAEKYAPSMPSAMRIVRDAKGLAALVSGVMGPAVAATFARRGDVVLVTIDGRESLAVCTGAQAAGPGVDGLMFVAPGGWQCAWHVG